MTSSTQTSNGDFFGCKICCLRGVPFNESSIKAHLQTKGHKFMKVLSENDLWPETSDSAAAASEPKIFRFLNAAQSTAILCRLCGCVLDDADSLFDHQLDESHKINWSGLTTISCPTVYFCPPCDVMLLGIENYSAHCTTSSHNKNLADAYQTSVGGRKFPLPNDPELDYPVTIQKDKYSNRRKRSRSKSPEGSSRSSSSCSEPESSIPQKHYAEEKPEAKKSIAGLEDDLLRCLARKLAKSLGRIEDPESDTTSKKPKIDEKFQHEATTAAKSSLPDYDLETTTTLSKIDFLQQQIENEKQAGNREKIERLSKFLDFLTNQIREEKSMMLKQAEKIRKLENLAENYLNEKISLEKEEISRVDTLKKLAILLTDVQEQSMEKNDNQSIIVESSAKDKLLPSDATLQYSTQLRQSLATIGRAKAPSTAVKTLVGKRHRPLGSTLHHNKELHPVATSNTSHHGTKPSSAGASQSTSDKIATLRAELAHTGQRSARFENTAAAAPPPHQEPAPVQQRQPENSTASNLAATTNLSFCSRHGYTKHTTAECKNEAAKRCFFCRSRGHQVEQCDRPCKHCGQIRLHRSIACPMLQLAMAANGNNSSKPAASSKLLCSYHGYGAHTTEDCRIVAKNRNDDACCSICHSRRHPSGQCDHVCKHCGTTGQHRATACPTLAPGANSEREYGTSLPLTSAPLDTAVTRDATATGQILQL